MKTNRDLSLTGVGGRGIWDPTPAPSPEKSEEPLPPLIWSSVKISAPDGRASGTGRMASSNGGGKSAVARKRAAKKAVQKKKGVNKKPVGGKKTARARPTGAPGAKRR